MLAFRFFKRGQNLWAVASLTVGLLLGSAAVAQDQDKEKKDGYLDRVRRLNEIAAQKVETEVREALREADRLSSKDPARAAERLKTALTALEEDTALSQNRRESLMRIVKSRIRLAEAAAARGVSERDVSPPIGKIRFEGENRRAAEQENLSQSLAAIRSLQKQGKYDEARRLADDLGRRYPSNPAVQAAMRTTTTSDNLANATGQRQDLNNRLVGVSRDVQRSSLPAGTEMEFPKDWRERVKMRSKNPYPVSAKVRAILKALNTPVTVNFKSERFEDAIKYLADKMDLPIVLDKAALEEAQVTYETPVTLEVTGISVRTVLRKMLAVHNLAYVIKEDRLEITSALKAKEMLVTRTYFIGDLVGVGQFGGFLTNPFLNQLQTAQQIHQIIELIQSSIEPTSWREAGGNGTISFHAPTMSLVIRQSAEVHAMLSGGMK
jgi:hypothetical protein